jgi:hypothetical protein
MRHQLNKWCNYLTSIGTCAHFHNVKSVLFWNITQRICGNSLLTFWDNKSFSSSRIFLDFLTLEDGTDRLSRNIGKELPLHAA